MKKLMLSALLIGALGFTSCGSDDDASAENDNCVTCEAYEAEGESVPAVDVCKGENGNAFIGGTDVGFSYDDYIALSQLVTTCQ